MSSQTRPYNFSAGPAMLPESLLLEAQSQLLNWNDTGVSMLEVGHRSASFQALMDDTQATLRALLSIPENYAVLFLGGAARAQFSMIPMNLLNADEQAAYLVSGVWSSMAYAEACKLKQAYCIATSEASHYTTLPDYHVQSLRSNTRYVYYTPNETVNGVRFSPVPVCGTIPLIADMTSCLLTEPINIADYGLIFAGAQKNIANAGLTIVIIRNDLLDSLPTPAIPTMMDYRVHVQHNSLYATPPTFNCYIANRMFHWISAQGGVDALYKINCEKAARLYQAIDESTFYSCPIEKSARSIVNVCFKLNRPELEDEFLYRATQQGLYGLKGHKLVGGLRASLYNAMPLLGVEALINFMHDFSRVYSECV